MTDLRKAAEMALEALAWEEIEDAKEHLRQALAQPKREWVGLIKDEVDSLELPDSPTVFEFAQFVEAKLKEKNA